MALPEETLSIVEQWKKKSIEMSSQSNDAIVSLLSKGIDTMAVVLNKKSDLEKVQRALISLESERSLSFQFDKNKNDEVRSLVYGHIECLHSTLSELTKERNQVKEFGEMVTQTDLVHPLPSDQLKESAEICTQTEEEPSQPSLVYPLHSNDYSHNDFDYPHEEPPVNWLEVPKEELFDEVSIKNEDIRGDEVLPNDNANTRKDGDLAVDSGDVASKVINDDRAYSEMPALNYVGCEPDFENEFLNEVFNDTKANEIMGEDRKQDSSDTGEVEERRISPREVSRPVKSANSESLEDSDEDYEPTMKKTKAESLKMKKKRSSDVMEKKSRSASSTGKSREMKCIECEFKTTSAGSFTNHLKLVHSTTLLLAGFALRCDCGFEALSYKHGLKCDIGNYTVVQVRDGPIRRFEDEKTTPQCILCDAYPKTALGYIQHLQLRHKSSLRAHGIWLLCECGAKYRSVKPVSEHTKECTHREFTLHRVSEENQGI